METSMTAARPQARILDLAAYLPTATLSNDALAAQYPEWSAAKILAKTGIGTRHIAAPDETWSRKGWSRARRSTSSCCAPRRPTTRCRPPPA
jgi:3-oxoacyl-[acyl-carrier-protein] synthase-3